MTEKKIILLVDDTPANIQVVNAILKDVYKTRIASNGAKAIELANAGPQPDLDSARRHHARHGRV